MTHPLVFGVLLMGIFSSLFGCRKSDTPPQRPKTKAVEVADVYRDLRGQALQLSPDQLGLTIAPNEPVAILMEFSVSGNIVTLVCVTDGTTSLYFSNGGGIIGAGEHAAVRAISQKMISAAQEHLADMKQTNDFPLPLAGSVRFYCVTAEGVVTTEVAEEALAGQHPLSALFRQGHEVIAAIRQHAPN
ncbi:hypothetical protein HED60_09165 [Planctomycetales bacterium ZRK34]|nr:hypothetical protein HED60_09165 [Planctomycetales bacterium ZRK34]